MSFCRESAHNKPMDRLFVFDVDGTLLPHPKDSLSKNTVSALNQLLQDGDAICFCSGRPFRSLKKLLSELGPGQKFAGMANGACLKDFEGKTLFTHPLDLSVLDHFVEKYKDRKDLHLYAYGLDDEILYYEDSHFVQEEIDINEIKGIRLSGKEDKAQKILKVMVASDGENVPLELTPQESWVYSSTRSSPHFFEIMALESSKKNLVEYLWDYLGIHMVDIYCFGDSQNDVGMLDYFHGIAMGNAVYDAKEAAETVTRTCENEGVYYALKEVYEFVD